MQERMLVLHKPRGYEVTQPKEPWKPKATPDKKPFALAPAAGISRRGLGAGHEKN